MKKPPDGQFAVSNISEWRDGWRTVAGGTIGTGTGLGLFLMTASLFIVPMRDEFGWPTAIIAFAPIVSMLMAFFSPLAGYAVQRFGARRLALLSLVGFALLELALFAMPNNRGYLYATILALGVVGAAGSPIAYTRGVLTRFKAHAGAALGITLCGSSLAGLVGTPLIGWVIASHGWRAGYLSISLTVLLFGAPSVYWLFHEAPTPGSAHDQGPRGSGTVAALRDGCRDVRFWLLVVTFLSAALSMGAFTTHLQPLLLDGGMRAATAAWMGSLFALSIGAGRLISGVLVDRVWDCGVAATLIAVSAAGAASLATLGAGTPLWLISLAVAAVGLAQGAEGDFCAYFTLKIFGIERYAPLFSVQLTILTFGLAAGGIGGSVLFDATGHYELMIVSAAICLAIASGLMLALGLVDRRLGASVGTWTRPSSKARGSAQL